MNLIELSKYLQDEQAAENYLYEKGILKKYKECPHCGFDKLGHLSRNRIKCYKCKKEWHKRKDSILNSIRVEASKIIAILKLYCDGSSISQISNEVEVDRKTIHHLFSILNRKLSNDFSEIANISQLLMLDVNSSGLIEIKPNSKEEKSDDLYGKSFIIRIVRRRESDGEYNFRLEVVNSKRSEKEFNRINTFMNFANHYIQFYRVFKEAEFLSFLYFLVVRFNNLKNDFYEVVVEKLKIS